VINHHQLIHNRQLHAIPTTESGSVGHWVSDLGQVKTDAWSYQIFRLFVFRYIQQLVQVTRSQTLLDQFMGQTLTQF